MCIRDSAYIEAHHGACVCQNVVDEAGRACHPYVIHTLGNGLRVGIVGIVTDYVNVWERKENLAGICITDPFEAAKEALLHLKKEVDITLCIYHGGFECDLKTGERLQKTTENVGYRICKEDVDKRQECDVRCAISLPRQETGSADAEYRKGTEWQDGFWQKREVKSRQLSADELRGAAAQMEPYYEELAARVITWLLDTSRCV